MTNDRITVSRELLRQTIDLLDDMLAPGATFSTDSLRAALEQSGVEPDGWRQDHGLLYRLTDDPNPQNRDEINVTMADGSRSVESRTRRASELLDRIRHTAPQPAKQGMEFPERHDLGREVFDKICEMETEDRFTTIADVKEAVRCIVFSVRQAPQPAQQLEVALRKVMSRIAELLDEDQFAEIENIVLGAGVAPQPQQPAGEPVAWWKQYPDGNVSVVEGKVFLTEDALCRGWRPLGFVDAAPQPQQSAPVQGPVPLLTEEDIHQMWLNSPFRGSGGQADWFKEGVRVGIQAVRQKAGLK